MSHPLRVLFQLGKAEGVRIMLNTPNYLSWYFGFIFILLSIFLLCLGLVFNFNLFILCGLVGTIVGSIGTFLLIIT